MEEPRLWGLQWVSCRRGQARLSLSPTGLFILGHSPMLRFRFLSHSAHLVHGNEFDP